MKYINLQDILQPGQNYILDYAREFGKEIQAVKHDKATNTCFEKADLINFDPMQVVKSVYLWDNNGKFYGFVAPELGTRERPLKFDEPLIKRIFREDKIQAKKLMGLRNSFSPTGMEHGTFTPFVPDYYFDGDGFTGTLDRIYVYGSQELNGKKADISIGGFGEESHKISVLLNYEDIYEGLNWKFPGKIEKFNL